MVNDKNRDIIRMMFLVTVVVMFCMIIAFCSYLKLISYIRERPKLVTSLVLYEQFKSLTPLLGVKVFANYYLVYGMIDSNRLEGASVN